MRLTELKEILKKFQDIFHELIDPSAPKTGLNAIAAYIEKELATALALLNHRTRSPDEILNRIRNHIELIKAEANKYELPIDELSIPTTQHPNTNLSLLQKLLDPKTPDAANLIMDLKYQQAEVALLARMEAVNSKFYGGFLSKKLNPLPATKETDEKPLCKSSLKK